MRKTFYLPLLVMGIAGLLMAGCGKKQAPAPKKVEAARQDDGAMNLDKAPAPKNDWERSFLRGHVKTMYYYVSDSTKTPYKYYQFSKDGKLISSTYIKKVKGDPKKMSPFARDLSETMYRFYDFKLTPRAKKLFKSLGSRSYVEVNTYENGREVRTVFSDGVDLKMKWEYKKTSDNYYNTLVTLIDESTGKVLGTQRRNYDGRYNMWRKRNESMGEDEEYQYESRGFRRIPFGNGFAYLSLLDGLYYSNGVPLAGENPKGIGIDSHGNWTKIAINNGKKEVITDVRSFEYWD